MLFSSIIFLCAFLPLTLLLYNLCPRFLKNGFLLLASLVFYAWGEPRFALLMVGSVALNYGYGLLIARDQRIGKSGKLPLAIAIALNLAILGYFKYVNFFIQNINGMLAQLDAAPLHYAHIVLPLGISFYTFQAISYLVDVYRNPQYVQRNPATLGLYIALFPQLIAGPIVRYHDVMAQLASRVVTAEGLALGIERFVLGLAKKLLIANTLGGIADAIFALPEHQWTASTAWLGIVCYSLQIYFDFSGYSDMAIGLGRMFGFQFLENFNYPYIAGSITEFWRRWHISLSSWFRDYLYIPLGGNRVSPGRLYFNLALVFLLCGLWHGASWNFVVWGLFHGGFLILERLVRLPLGLDRWRPLRHGYALLVVMIGWVFFKAETLPQALAYLQAMAGWGAPSTMAGAWEYLTPTVLLALAAGALGSLPWLPWLKQQIDRLEQQLAGRPLGTRLVVGSRGTAAALAQIALLGACLVTLSASTYNPFIYFRF